jgi:hypothetical protein
VFLTARPLGTVAEAGGPSRGHAPPMLKRFTLITVASSWFTTVAHVFGPMLNKLSNPDSTIDYEYLVSVTFFVLV